MKKILLFIPALIAAVYVVLRLPANENFAKTLDLFYGAVTAAVVLFVAFRCFSKAAKVKDRDALFTGALGLGMFAVSVIYDFTYTLISGAGDGLNISDFSGVCTYLFFLAAIMLLLLPPHYLYMPLKIGINVLSAVIILITVYAVMLNKEKLLYMTVIATAFICAALSAYLLHQTKKIKLLKTAGLFACFIIIFSLADMAGNLFSFLNTGGFLSYVFAALHMPVILYISEGLLRLREGE